MTRLLMLVEGQSEEIFVKHTLTPHLAQHSVFVESPIVLWTKRLPSGGGSRGGVTNWNQIRRNLLPLTRDGDAWISTLLDFYGLPEDFPGLPEALSAGNPQEKIVALQNRFAAELNHQRFIPFLVLHESRHGCSARRIPSRRILARTIPILPTSYKPVVQQAGAPELINHGADTHPKARLHSLVSGYKETSDGPTLLEKMGIAAVRVACPHFDSWLNRLETLGGGAA